MRIKKNAKQILSILVVSLLLMLLVFYLITTRNSKLSISKSALKLNTYITVTLYGTNDEKIIDEAFSLCDSYEQLFSKTIETSDVYKFNHRTTADVTVSPATAELIQYGLQYCKLTNSAFDIAIGQLSSLWDFTSDKPSLPDANDIKEALNHVGYTNLTIDGTTLHSDDNELEIDLGGIAKGYIADKMKEFLIQKGVKSATINLGGNTLCIGSKPDNSPFMIGIQKPFSEQGEVLLGIKITDYSVVTSGTYERFFRLDNKLYHHILNPLTGYPYDNDLTSVTIISEKSVDGDGLSTSCFALGLKDGMKLIDSLDNTYAIFVTNEGEIYYSKGLKDKFTVIEQ